MDDFRVGSVFPDPYRDTGSSDQMKRKKRQSPKGPSSEEDDQVVISDRSEAGAEQAEDCYTPSDRADESE